MAGHGFGLLARIKCRVAELMTGGPECRYPVHQDRLTCSRSRLCSLRRTSIFPMTSWSRPRSSSMSRCCLPSRSCRAGQYTGCSLTALLPNGGLSYRGTTSQLLILLPDPQLSFL